MAREIDSDALRAYRDLVQTQLEKLEDELIPKLRSGQELGRMPAFGSMDGAPQARTNYTAFHEGTWNNLQAIRESLHGIITTLNDSGDLSDESDEVTANSFDSELEG
ncbi:hypothetical protein K3N28_12670 [Glycomyces sp. TRM65418]|uniref:hypothetical protein n=1 Tax=Glycomyces sp. TRM65418 TaxID=2867006 RepID=UPI001CE6277E|nr:hypothetical protein [Glycomyces sp. TRM65418]MCC3763918.1 hypothetical protein [Glycomyces sp. TRM65418]QZD53620.1 hypothetical protein K3N28_12600 [Glycomyces sp. TRM65418]